MARHVGSYFSFRVDPRGDSTTTSTAPSPVSAGSESKSFMMPSTRLEQGACPSECAASHLARSLHGRQRESQHRQDGIMAFRLRQHEQIADGLRRLSRKEIESARRQLERKSPPGDTAVHDARTSVKKVRAVLDLIEAEG